MKLSLSILAALVMLQSVFAQQPDFGTATPIRPSENLQNTVEYVKYRELGIVSRESSESLKTSENAEASNVPDLSFQPVDEPDEQRMRLSFFDAGIGETVGKYDKFDIELPIGAPKETNYTDSNSFPKEKFHWKPAVAQSFYFLGIQHGLRLVQNKTKRELDGPFFRDWGRSVRNLSDWEDGDGIVTNYIFHPMQGAVTGWIFLVNSDKSIKQGFGGSKDYWLSRFKAMAWSAAWSAQFELGPVSEASIGNVGLYDNVGPNTMGWVDLVITPVAGTSVIVIEDIIDKYILENWLEKKLTSRTRIKIYRTFFNPFQSFVNVLRWKKPWRRRNR